MACAVLLSLGVPLMVDEGHAQATNKWYYCDPAHAYYPYVSTCSVPWREVIPNPNPYGQAGSPQVGTGASAPPSTPLSLTPSPSASVVPAPSDSQPSAAFQEGQADRQSWEAWFASLMGANRAGAEYWAAHRSVAKPKPCDAAPQATAADWAAGCFAAQHKLAASDIRRKTDPEYRLGWNNPPAVASAPVSATSAATLSAAPQEPTTPPAVVDELRPPDFTPSPSRPETKPVTVQAAGKDTGSSTDYATPRSSNELAKTGGSSEFGGPLFVLMLARISHTDE